MTTENIKESNAPRGAREPFFLARLADPLSLGGCVGLNFAWAPSSSVGVVIGRSTRSLIAGAKRSPHSDIQDSRMRATLVRSKPNAQTREPRHADAPNQTLGYSKSNTCTFQIRHLALRPPKPTTRTLKTRHTPNHSKPARTCAERDDQTLITQRSEIQNTTPRHTKAKTQTLNTQCPDIRKSSKNQAFRYSKPNTQTAKANSHTHPERDAQTPQTQHSGIQDATTRNRKASTQTLKAQCSDVLKPFKTRHSDTQSPTLRHQKKHHAHSQHARRRPSRPNTRAFTVPRTLDPTSRHSELNTRTPRIRRSLGHSKLDTQPAREDRRGLMFAPRTPPAPSTGCLGAT